MARGKSGRIVLEIDPMLKRQLYSSLARSGDTLKDWFVERAEDFVRRSNRQMLLSEEFGEYIAGEDGSSRGELR